MNQFSYLSTGEADTQALGQALADFLPDGSLVGLFGTLGSGKTRLVQAIAEATGVDRRQVVSPTFVLVQEYTTGRRPIYHFDTYRLRDEDEFLQLGPEEYYDRNGLVLIEWADRVLDVLPRDRVEIHFEVIGEQARAVRIVATTPRYEPLLDSLTAWAQQRAQTGSEPG